MTVPTFLDFYGCKNTAVQSADKATADLDTPNKRPANVGC